MIALPVKDLQALFNGQFIQGATNFSVKQALHYQQLDSVRRYALVFLRKSEEVDWKRLAQLTPLVIVSDKAEEELRKAPASITILHVKNMHRAFWQFVDYYRELFTIPVVALTGTCGKTTTKEMIRHILLGDWPVQATVSSINEPRQSLNYLTMVDQQTKAAVFELGLGNLGNIKHQCLIYKPTIGIITNIGVHHLDGCKSLQGYIQAKAEIVEGIQENGTLIMNADDDNSKKISLAAFKGKVVTFSVKKNANFKASNIQYVTGGMRFSLTAQKERFDCFVPGYGEHQVYNALAAFAATTEMGFPLRKAIAKLRTFKNMERHLQFSKGVAGSTIIDDTWTNNPTSIEAALKVLEAVGKGKKRIVILGDIKRLGKYERQYHREIGSLIAKQSIDTLITIGKSAKEIAIQAKADGTKAAVHSFTDVTGVMELLRKMLTQNSIVLIKGPMSSRSMIDFASELKGNNKSGGV
ncbi:UDP-N-acetylmuramoyl-tripeptide--D-alanyl-D-alanine ligase [Bacillus ndiopicus]|uniref:UDP-N-acetylmuramoyl-tripeptide--D-alanyl-D- alanine ligase n=1 Tax=Bacillus ndiopicus TaxID=1347368 RepID=UPI0005A94BF8|nr:UDP-N-acetylmuramoyl-tripeptide--D-alanyl-D-alanine ligase [Bacillus ndiopicus]